MAEGAPLGSGRRAPPEEEFWLVCEWRATGEQKYYLCNHLPDAPLKMLVRAIKARCSCEQAHEQMKNDLGLEHLKCRGWDALQHHTMLVMMAMAFLQHLRLGGKRKARARVGPPPFLRCPRSEEHWPSISGPRCTCAARAVRAYSRAAPIAVPDRVVLKRRL
jgi:hypothetical protein